jgi:transcriptional regulator with XRE-family HTH domain
MKTIGETIKEFRKANHLSLRDFAQRAGLSHAYIAKLEKEYDPVSKKKIEPTMDTVAKLAEAMHMSVESLLAETGYIEDGQDEQRQIKTWHPAITQKDEKDIAKDLERIMNDLTQADGLDVL